MPLYKPNRRHVNQLWISATLTSRGSPKHIAAKSTRRRVVKRTGT